jgi:hypothetical protein
VTVNIIETLGASESGGTAAVTITTSLVSTDRVVVACVKSTTSGTVVVSGFSATWTNNAFHTLSGADVNILSASGMTGTGTVTVNGLNTGGDMVVYVLRSSVGNAVVYSVGSGNGTASTAASTVVTTSSNSALAGSMLFMAGTVTAGNITMPATGASPSSGWTQDRLTASRRKVMHVSTSSNVSLVGAVTSDATWPGAVVVAAYYDNDVPTPPAAGFTGWGVPIF